MKENTKENTKARLINLWYDVWNLDFFFIALFIIAALCIGVLYLNVYELNLELGVVQENMHMQDKRIEEFQETITRADSIVANYNRLRQAVYKLKYYSGENKTVFGKY